MTKFKRILYLGSYQDEAIIKERGLSSHNAAGSNRMMRLSEALGYMKYRPVILSPAISLRSGKAGGPFLLPARVRRKGKVIIVHAPAINVFGLNILTTFFFQAMTMARIRRRGTQANIVYNYSPTYFLLALWLRLSSRVPLLNNIEDIAVPRWSDWSKDSEARPVQQGVFWVCQYLVARVCDGYIVPTRRFLDFLPRKRATEIVTGCISVPEQLGTGAVTEKIRVMFAGKIEREHGIVQFIEALELLDKSPEAKRFEVDITGAGHMSDWVAERVKGIQHLTVRQHGFVSAEAYRNILSSVHVCAALQDPTGRYSDLKTPSKLYEFFGSGKAVISTDVGDIKELPSKTIIIIDKLDPNELYSQFRQLAVTPDRITAIQHNAYQHAVEEFAYPNVGRRLLDLLKVAQHARSGTA